QRLGDCPSQAEFVSRFPRHGLKLPAALARIDAELAAEFGRRERALPVDSAAQRQTLSPPDRGAGLLQPASAAAFVETLRQYQLLDTARLDKLGEELLGRVSAPHALTRELIRRAWLTPYQANQLLLGRGHELVLGPYVLLERLGEGGAGQVFKARHQKMDRIVALKLIRKELLADAEVVGRFYREIQVLSQLDHPNVVHAFDAGPAGQTHFLAMEYIEGTDLGRLVKQSGSMPVEQACAYV